MPVATLKSGNVCVEISTDDRETFAIMLSDGPSQPERSITLSVQAIKLCIAAFYSVQNLADRNKPSEA